MSPAEGFLLSRIDGTTPWRLLREIGAIPAEEVDRALARWLEEGLLVLEGVTGDLVPRGEQGSHGEAAPAAMKIDASVDLAPELQREIVEFEASLPGRSYFEILGVDREADTREIKKAYFALSKKFHPDRYYRREVGRFGALIERIFKSVMEAYELLSDPATRAEVEKDIAWAPPPEPAPAAEAAAEQATGQGEAPQGYRVPSRMENLRRLRDRFRPPAELVADRRIKARQFFQAAQLSMQQQRWLEAAASARLSIAFDPWNPQYKTGFVEIQAHVNRERAVALLEEAQDAEAQSEAMRLLEEALHFRPLDPEANARAATLALQMNDLERATEYADAAADIEPEVAAHHVLRARVLRRAGDLKAAKKAIAQASQLAPDDEDVRAERRLQSRGGRA